MILNIYKVKKKQESYRIINIANPKVIKLKNYILNIEKHTGLKSIQTKLPLQKGDIKFVKADISKVQKITKFKNFTSINKGISQFIKWFKDYYNVS